MKRHRTALAAALLAAPVIAVAASFEATVNFARRMELGLPVSGVVATVGAEAGTRVTKGQVLVALDETPFQAAVEQARGALARASADRDEAVRDHKTMKEIYDRQLASTVELDNARLRVQRAEGALTQARAALKQAQLDLARSRITAPFDALVLDMRVHAGTSVVSTVESRPVVVLAAHGEYLAAARVPGAAVDTLKAGQGASVTVAGKTYTGRVQAIGLEALADKSSSEPLYLVTVAFHAPETPLRAGQSARIEFR
jgi:RND family efflux transporter MFP subunit